MNQQSADGREYLRTSVLKTLFYADIFDYPLTLHEICRYLPGVDTSLAEVSSLLNDKSFAGDRIYQPNGFFALSNKTELGELREMQPYPPLGTLYAQATCAAMVTTSPCSMPRWLNPRQTGQPLHQAGIECAIHPNTS